MSAIYSPVNSTVDEEEIGRGAGTDVLSLLVVMEECEERYLEEDRSAFGKRTAFKKDMNRRRISAVS